MPDTTHEKLLEAMGGIQRREDDLILFDLKHTGTMWYLYTPVIWWHPIDLCMAHALIEHAAEAKLLEWLRFQGHQHIIIEHLPTGVDIHYCDDAQTLRLVASGETEPDALLAGLLAMKGESNG